MLLLFIYYVLPCTICFASVVAAEKQHQNLLDGVEHFDKTQMKHTTTEEKNPLPPIEGLYLRFIISCFIFSFLNYRALTHYDNHAHTYLLQSVNLCLTKLRSTWSCVKKHVIVIWNKVPDLKNAFSNCFKPNLYWYTHRIDCLGVGITMILYTHFSLYKLDAATWNTTVGLII